MSHSNTSPCAAIDSHFAPACFLTPEPEVWRSVPGYGSLEASSHGRLRNGATGHVLKLRLNNQGYLQTGFTVNGRWRTANAHRMVCLAFNGLPPYADWHAAHKDSDRTNNRADNMEWQSPQENWAAPERRVRCIIAAARRKAGSTNAAHALEEHARILSLFEEGHTIRQIATTLGRAYSSVKRAITLSGSMTGSAQLAMAERLAS